MLVRAKCVMRAWDSEATVMYEPGFGPLPGGLYEIDRDGPLAHMKLGSTYVFDFDRNGIRTNDGVDVVKDYSCKKEGCGKKFKTLNALGTHTREAHKDDPNPLAEPDAEVVVVKSQQGKHKNRTFTCKVEGCGAVLPHLYALKLHKREHANHVQVEVTEGAVEQAA
jgi:hypothetical protein